MVRTREQVFGCVERSVAERDFCSSFFCKGLCSFNRRGPILLVCFLRVAILLLSSWSCLGSFMLARVGRYPCRRIQLEGGHSVFVCLHRVFSPFHLFLILFASRHEGLGTGPVVKLVERRVSKHF